MELKSGVDCDRLIRWFRDNGGHLHDAIEMLHSPDYGYHYIAKSKAMDVKECDFVSILLVQGILCQWQTTHKVPSLGRVV